MASSRRYTAPRRWVAAGGEWPVGPLSPDAPGYAAKTAALVVRLEAALIRDGRSARAVCIEAGIDPGTLSRLRSGQSIPDLGTIHALEVALKAELWGGTS